MKKKIFIAIGSLAIIVALIGMFFTMQMLNDSEVHYVYIDNDDNIDSVYTKVRPHATAYGYQAFKMAASALGYADHIRTGRYAIEPGVGGMQTLRHFRNGIQAPIALTIPSVRTLDRLAEEVSKRLMMNEDELLDALKDKEVCKKYGLDTLTIQCMFIPNTYDIYWNITVENFLERMQKESDSFWTSERLAKAKEAGMTENEVITLASIVDEETANDDEKPMIAGMYINRLKINMPLQADPTVKYAWGDFSLKRIYNKLLSIDSPYNTYRNAGLPPGPIRIPSVAGIDAVLNHVHHDYIYMCAKEDFSGTHNFAVTYAEHLQNAAKYSKALNERGIK